ncbi:MAG: glycine cleavage system protein T [Actinobacteria bacterium RBG_16_70_17]|nr:MAG: glycine cleavage system protein T [Actinobacteria bacterium RBG_16_70_17]
MAEQVLNETPLSAWHHSHGGKMVDFGGWDMPVQYESGILAEHLATRRYGGIWDVSHMGRLRIRGRDRLAFLQHVLSNNAGALEPWRAQYTLIPNEAGGVVDDAYLYRFGEDDFILVVNASNRLADLEHLHRHAAAFGDLAIEDCTSSLGMIAFQGPLTGEVLESLLEGGSLPEPRRNALSSGRIAGVETLISRTGYTGEPIAFELLMAADAAEAVWNALVAAGAGRGIVPCGLGARDTLRLEGALPLYGHELGIDPEGKEFPAYSFPLTSSAVSFTEAKGDFVGRAALHRQFEQDQLLKTDDYRGSEVLPRRTRCLAILGEGIARQGHEVFLGERKVGFVTSGSIAPYWKFEGEGALMSISDAHDRRAIALACLDAALAPGVEVEVDVRGRRVAARVVEWHGRSDAPPYFRAIPAARKVGEAAVPRLGGPERAGEVLARSLANHEWRQRSCINLIPSEMTQSPLVRLLQVSDPMGRYAEHRELAAFGQEVFYYQGTDFIAWVEEQVAREMADYLGCRLIESRVISGQMANMTVFSALVDHRNRVDRRREPQRIRLAMNNHIGKGGHLSAQPMGALRDYIARDPKSERPAVVNFPVREDNPYRIDVEATGQLLEEVEPEIIIFGKSMVLHPEPVAEIRAMVAGKEDRPLIMYDMAHVLGLVGPHFQQPFADGADIVTGSTHKTFFGPQRGIIGVDFPEGSPDLGLWKAIRRRTFPGMVSNHHLGTLLALLLAAIEMNTFKDQYQPQVVANAKAFARALAAEGLDVQGDPSVDYTETHQVIVAVGYARGAEVARALEERNIICNYQAIPSDEGFTASSGLRLGVSEMTRFGMVEQDFAELGALFAAAVRDEKGIAGKIAEFRGRFQTMRFCFDGGGFAAARDKLLATF